MANPFDLDTLVREHLRLRKERVFEPESLAPRIAIRTAINSRRVTNHILLILFDDFLEKHSRATWALTPVLHGPGA